MDGLITQFYKATGHVTLTFNVIYTAVPIPTCSQSNKEESQTCTSLTVSSLAVSGQQTATNTWWHIIGY